MTGEAAAWMSESCTGLVPTRNAGPRAVNCSVAPAERAAKGVKPAVFMVGPNVLCRSKRIAGAVYAGPGQSAAGIAMLKAALEKLPRDREVVVYCGCCPWDRCPNVKPAMELMKSMGFAN